MYFRGRVCGCRFECRWEGSLKENRVVDDAWKTGLLRRSVRLLRVFTDLDKFNRLVEFDSLAYKPYLVEFDFLAYKPYLLSLRNFSAREFEPQDGREFSGPDDLTLIRTALKNVARVFSFVSGGERGGVIAEPEGHILQT